jgi:ABC-2 type transport system ATP-binding protein
MATDQPEALMDALDRDAIAYRRGADGAFEAVGVEPGSIAKLASARGLVLTELSLQRASLEEAFMEMTADAVEYHAGPANAAAATAPHVKTSETSEYAQRKRG